jgi:hypothetical protein
MQKLRTKVHYLGPNTSQICKFSHTIVTLITALLPYQSNNKNQILKAIHLPDLLEM